VLYIYICKTRLASKEIFSPSNKKLMAIPIVILTLLCTIPTVTNSKAINVQDTIIEDEISTTNTVIYV